MAESTPITAFSLTFIGFKEDDTAKQKLTETQSSTDTRDKEDGDAKDKVLDEFKTHNITAVETTKTGFSYSYTDTYTLVKITDVDDNKKKTTITTTITTTEIKTLYIKDPTASFNISNAETEVTIGSFSTKVSLDYLTFNRQLYKPNEIIADIQIAESVNNKISLDDLQIFLQTKVKLTLFYNYTDGDGQQKSDNKDFTDFYVYKLLPLKQANKDLYVRLYIYSLDHQLTLKKYSRTYVAKKLATDILLAKKDSAFVFNSVPTPLRWPFEAAEYTDGGEGLKFFDHLGYLHKVTEKKEMPKSNTDATIEEKNTEVKKDVNAFSPIWCSTMSRSTILWCVRQTDAENSSFGKTDNCNWDD